MVLLFSRRLTVIRVKHADDYYAYKFDKDWFQCKSDGIIGCNMVQYIIYELVYICLDLVDVAHRLTHKPCRVLLLTLRIDFSYVEKKTIMYTTGTVIVVLLVLLAS